jgi:hypothetical protein
MIQPQGNGFELMKALRSRPREQIQSMSLHKGKDDGFELGLMPYAQRKNIKRVKRKNEMFENLDGRSVTC